MARVIHDSYGKNIFSDQKNIFTKELSSEDEMIAELIQHQKRIIQKKTILHIEAIPLYKSTTLNKQINQTIKRKKNATNKKQF